MSVYVPGFTSDLFISYAALDDRAAEANGWVTEFHKRLRIALGSELGDEPEVWFDKSRLKTGDTFSSELENGLRSTALLVVIVSPSYRNSNWCDWELTGFVDRHRSSASRNGALDGRTFIVVKRPVEGNWYRTRRLHEMTRIDFYRTDNGRSYELAPRSEAFQEQMMTLAADIATALRGMRKQRTAYLGPAPPLMQLQRESVRQELAARGYRVLTPALAGTDAIDVEVRQAVDESALCLHFVDKNRPPEESYVTSAARRAAEELERRQIIAVKCEADAENLAVQEFSGEGLIQPLVNPSLQYLKKILIEELKRIVEPSERNARTRVYLLCHAGDHPSNVENRASALQRYLAERRIEVSLPRSAGQVQSLVDNKSKLESCDAVILYWGSSDENWFEQRLEELDQAVGWRKGRKFKVRAGYIADPDSSKKKQFETDRVDVLIKQFKTLDETDERFKAFLSKLVPASAAAASA